MLSRNSASSRAIPIAKRIEAAMDDPFVPEKWGMDARGMQARDTIGDQYVNDAREAWFSARRQAVEHAMKLHALGVHKQLTNRLLEPFLWHTCVVTATEWSNFFHLRRHKDAQPEFQRIANLMYDAMYVSAPTVKQHGEWHLPYVDPSTDQVEGLTIRDLAYISAARCARISYLNNGSRDPKADLVLSSKLHSNGHMSPFEHPAQALSDNAFNGNFRGWLQLRKQILDERDPLGPREHD